jgi:PIN domain nuclease of toxin-antitoxin system
MLLDTCALLWLAEGGTRLSTAAREAIRGADELWISAISGFEIALKCRSGKLVLPAQSAEWFQVVLDQHHIQVVPLDLAVCLGATSLPQVHRDPCDRFILATSRRFRWPVVTADTRFAAYGVEVIW